MKSRVADNSDLAAENGDLATQTATPAAQNGDLAAEKANRHRGHTSIGTHIPR